MPRYLVTITETIEYHTEVEADSIEQARSDIAEAMASPTWEDPRNSNVCGQEVTDVQPIVEART